ncbi:Poly(A) polymerase [Glycine soja]|nr:Poly(A) polymerase [Glycine soja]
MGNPGLNNRDNGQQQRLGITEPISLGGPTEYDVIKTRELEKYLQDAGLYENQQEAVVHSPGANIDTLCVGPRHASRDEDFFGDLHRMLSKMPEVTELHPVPDAHVPVMRFKFNGVYIDLLYAKLSLRKNYLQIDISGENADDLRKWKGWVESHLRQHIYGMLQCHPHPGDSSDKSRPFHCSNFMALQRKQGVPVNDGGQFDIRLTVEEFKHSVNIYTLWIPGMDVHVPHVKHRNIPTFVFPGSVRPSHPSKVTWEIK